MLTVSELGVFDSRKKFPDSGETPLRTVKEVEIEWYLTDEGTSHVDGENYARKKGMVVCARPGMIRSSRGHFSCLYVHLSSDETLERLLSPVPACFFPRQTERVQEQFLKLIELYHTPGSEARLSLEAELFRLMLLLLRSEHVSGPDGETVFRAEQFMREHFREPIKLADVAAAANLSPTYFHRCYHLATGRTPRAYLESLRLIAAKRALLTTEEPLEVIAEHCGFASQAYFQSVFRKATNETPGDFRKRKYSMPL